ncbi:MAG: hypothetical protein ACO2ZD_02760 [Pseudomonadales bacterium]
MGKILTVIDHRRLFSLVTAQASVKLGAHDEGLSKVAVAANVPGDSCAEQCAAELMLDALSRRFR